MASLHLSGSRGGQRGQERLIAQEMKMQKLMREARRKEEYEYYDRGRRLPHAAKVPVPQPPSQPRVVDPGSVGCCGGFRRRRLAGKKPPNPVPITPAPTPVIQNYKSEVFQEVSVPRARFSLTPLPPIGKKCEYSSAAEEEKVKKANKAHLKKVEKTLQGTDALRKANLKMTPNAEAKPKAYCAWELVERAAPVAPLRPPSQCAAMKGDESRPRSRVLGSVSEVSVCSRSSQSSFDTPPESRSASRQAGTVDVSHVTSRYKLPPQSRNEMLSKLREKELSSHVVLRENEEKRIEKVTEHKNRISVVRVTGSVARAMNPIVGNQRRKEIDRLKRAIEEGRINFLPHPPPRRPSPVEKVKEIPDPEKDLDGAINALLAEMPGGSDDFSD